MRESDLYSSVKLFLEKQGYTVKAEIEECDVMAKRDDEEPVVVELKLTLSLSVLLQAVQRMGISDKVYVAVPNDCAPLRNQYKQIRKLFRMLGIGLLAVHMGSRPAIVEVLLDPGPYHPRKSKPNKERLLKEFEERVGDPNVGGVARRGGVMTAYRQKALRIADFLGRCGPTKASVVAARIGEPKTRDILYSNVYGWFDRLGSGIYALSPKGGEESESWMGSGVADERSVTAI